MLYAYLLTSIAICLSDLYRRKITNPLVVILFVVTLFIAANSWLGIFQSTLLVLVIGLALFSARIWAGGDSKLLIALAPLFPLAQLPDLFFSILVCGGVLSGIYWVKYRLIFKGMPDQGLPYGVAIICGANLSLYFSQGLAIYS
ncbi:A24 family peptidase [Vibrio gallicus]|uniref:A24 family peptidase n=1 Tax=Vibrio gallicus TaxID=190897 RepID=UPI0021C40502|nr:prepilin peptidase [Vibrio gallicus]